MLCGGDPGVGNLSLQSLWHKSGSIVSVSYSYRVCGTKAFRGVSNLFNESLRPKELHRSVIFLAKRYPLFKLHRSDI